MEALRLIRLRKLQANWTPEFVYKLYLVAYEDENLARRASDEAVQALERR